ncbi:hypothetical protein ABM90_10435 [Rhodococcus erythropolis]|nr:hypothetical protein ABM90_10435 [Rhodococcus erythropolis]
MLTRISTCEALPLPRGHELKSVIHIDWLMTKRAERAVPLPSSDSCAVVVGAADGVAQRSERREQQGALEFPSTR